MKTITVEFTDEEFTEVCNTLQLIGVMGVKLWLQGKQPKQEVIREAFSKIAKASFESRPG